MFKTEDGGGLGRGNVEIEVGMGVGESNGYVEGCAGGRGGMLARRRSERHHESGSSGYTGCMLLAVCKLQTVVTLCVV
jgi:hypothetical protein